MSATRFALTVTAAFAVALAACGKSDPAPAPPTDPKPADPTKAPDPAKDPAKDAETPREKDPTEGDKRVVPPPTDAPPPTDPPPTDPPPPTRAPDPTEKSATALFPLTATPGTIIKDPNPESPEGLIQRALLAAMEPDEAKGWAMFEALLHDDQKYGQALTYRREMNFPAMRRKVKLFLYEDPAKPVYKIDRIIEEGNIIRIFVHNKESMPTPCEVRLDATNHWKIGICSL